MILTWRWLYMFNGMSHFHYITSTAFENWTHLHQLIHSISYFLTITKSCPSINVPNLGLIAWQPSSINTYTKSNVRWVFRFLSWSISLQTGKSCHTIGSHGADISYRNFVNTLIWRDFQWPFKHVSSRLI